MSGQRWGIVGGGFLGLTLALRLAAAGNKVSVFEAGPQIGGLASAWQIGEAVWDRFYHVLLLSDEHLLALLRELGLDGEVNWKTTATRFFIDGTLYPLDNVVDYLRFPALGFLAKLRLAATILYASRIEEADRFENVTAIEWLTRWSGEEAASRIWHPLLRAKLGDMAEHASAAFIWAVVRRLYAARRSGLKVERFGYVPGGYAKVLTRFGERLEAEGVKIETEQRVRRVERLGGRFRVLSSSGEHWFDRVVVTAPAPVAAELCPQLSGPERDQLAAVPYIGVVCTSVLLARPLSGAYLTYIADPTLPLTAVVEMTALVDPAELGGNHLVYLPRYLGTASDGLSQAEDEVARKSVEGLLRVYPDLRESDIRAVRVARAKYVLPVPTVGRRGRLPVTTSIPSLYLVNSSQIVNGTLNLNETIGLVDEASAVLLRTAPDTRMEAAE